MIIEMLGINEYISGAEISHTSDGKYQMKTMIYYYMEMVEQVKMTLSFINYIKVMMT